MATCSLPAVSSTGRETRIALAANLLVAVVLRSQYLERRLNDTATETDDIQWMIREVRDTQRHEHTARPNGAWTPFEYYSRSMCDHLRVACLQR